MYTLRCPVQPKNSLALDHVSLFFTITFLEGKALILHFITQQKLLFFSVTTSGKVFKDQCIGFTVHIQPDSAADDRSTSEGRINKCRYQKMTIQC